MWSRHLTALLRCFRTLIAVDYIAAVSSLLIASAASAQAAEDQLIGVWNGFLEQTNVVECGNLAAEGGIYSLELLNNSGQTAGSRTFSVNGHGTSHIVLNELGIGNAYGTYRIKQLSGSAKAAVTCLTVFYRTGASGSGRDLDYAFSLPALAAQSSPTSGIFNSHNPEGRSTPVYNWLSVVNLGNVPLTSEVEIYDQNGTYDASRSFNVAALAAGERRDFALGHPSGQVVGLYKIVPRDTSASYSAFLSRYSEREDGGFRFAFSLPSQAGSALPGPVPVSTMGNAINWGEIANPTPFEVFAHAEVRDQSGTQRLTESITLPPYSQRHIFINTPLGEKNVGFLNVRCDNCGDGLRRLLVQSAFYGRRSLEESGVEWAYSSQAGMNAPAGAAKAVSFVNTYLSAANWDKLLNAGSSPLSFSYRLFGAAGSEVAVRGYAAAALGSIDLPIHQDALKDFVGLAEAEISSDGKTLRAETIRVYPAAGGGIGYIMNQPALYYIAGQENSGVFLPRIAADLGPTSDSGTSDSAGSGGTGGTSTADGSTAEGGQDGSPAGDSADESEPLTDLSSLIRVTTENERSTLDRKTRILTSTVTVRLTNISEQNVITPLHAVISMTASGVEMPGALGGPAAPPYQKYYFDLSAAAGAALEPGESITVDAEFRRPSTVRFEYTVTPFGRISTPSVNLPPVLQVNPLLATVAEGSTLTVAVNATDPNNDPVSLGAAPKLLNADFHAVSGTAANGIFQFSPAFGQRGKYQVAFNARDPDGAQTTQTAEITVTGVNHAPVITGSSEYTVAEGAILNFRIETSDLDNDSVQVSAIGVPDNAVFVQSTNSFTFAPDYDQQGNYQLTFTATDGIVQSSPLIVNITVTDFTPGQGGATELTLQVNPVQNPTLLTQAYISGAVNSAAGLTPPPAPVSALINSVSPATGLQGTTISVELRSTDLTFPAHFAAGQSSADFGSGITVNSLTVASPVLATANITIDPAAELGVRSINVTTGDETAISLIGFRVQKGTTTFTGTILDPDTGAPVGSAVISIQGTAITATTNPDGSFTLSGVPAGSQVLLINPPNHQFFTLSIDAPASGSTDLGTLGSPATLFDPAAPAAASIVSVLGRGAGRPIAAGNKEQLKQMIIDTLLLVGGDELGIIDEYGNQLNPQLSGNGPVSLRIEGVELIADRLLRDQAYNLADFLFSVSWGLEWGGSSGQMTLDALLAAMQTQVNQAWADPVDPENAVPLIIFSAGNTVPAEPPLLGRTTTLNALQAFILACSFFKEAQYRTDNQQASLEQNPLKRLYAQISEFAIPSAYAQVTPAGRFSRFWRSSFHNDSFPELIIRQGMDVFVQDSSFMSAAARTSVGAVAASGYLVGELDDRMQAMMAAYETALRVPTAPKITQVFKGPGGLQFHFDARDTRSNVFTLLHFANLNAKPEIVDILLRPNPDLEPKKQSAEASYEAILYDRNPPASGNSFYAMTGTWVRGNTDRITDGGISRSAISPWWGAEISNPPEGSAAAFRKSHLAYWLNMTSSIYTSDYSEPFIYVAEPLPNLGSIDAIAIDPDTDEVYVSSPPNQRIGRIEKKYGGLGDEFVFANTNFALPAQVGLAIDKDANLYTDNSASDSMYGGRLFRFTQDGAREFCGTANYFSQLLLYANPALVGKMAIGPDNRLYLYERMTGEVRQVDVNASYDPYRRVGQLYWGATAAGYGSIYDLEPQRGMIKSGVLYVLDSGGVNALLMGRSKALGIMVRIPLGED